MLGGLALLIDMESSPSLLRLIQFRQVLFRVGLELLYTWCATELHFLILVNDGNRITHGPKDIIRNQTSIQGVRFRGTRTSSSTSGNQHQDQTEQAIFQAHVMSPLESNYNATTNGIVRMMLDNKRQVPANRVLLASYPTNQTLLGALLTRPSKTTRPATVESCETFRISLLLVCIRKTPQACT